MRLAIISTHPIQYNAPWFALLAKSPRITLKVFYTWGQIESEEKFDPGFGKNISWDVPLLEGYEFAFSTNISKHPGTHHFRGIINPTLVNEIEEFQPSALLVFGWAFVSHLKILRHFKAKTQILFRGDSTLLDETKGFSIKKKLRRLFLTWIYSHIDMALYAGTANKAYFLRHGLAESQLVFAPHAVDNKRFTMSIQRHERRSFGIPSNAFVFIFAGKFERTKDPHLLLDAFIRLHDSKAHLLMVGNGILEEQLKEKVRQQVPEINSRIHFLPFKNQLEMPAIYRMGDVLVLPSRGETWGLTVNEAMACSMPVLVSDKCGCAVDLVHQGQNGFVFKHSDNNDLLNKMEILLADARQVTVMGKRSLEIIQSWQFEQICMAIENAVL